MKRKIIKVEWKGKILEGYYIQRPSIYEEGYIVLKIDNGYNVGLKLSECKILEEREEKIEQEKTKVEEKGDLTIISTGGTISSKVDYNTGGTIAKLSAKDFSQMFPELNKIGKLNTEIIPMIMSEDIKSDYWKLMAKTIYESVKENPVIITHGTDTLHFSSSIMNFMVQGGNFPKVFTGAQRSIDRGSSDANMNLTCSAIAAKKLKSNESILVMHATDNDDYCYAHHGTRVRKMHSSKRSAFQSINSEPIAKIYPNQEIELIENNSFHKKELTLDTNFEDKVALIYTYPNMDQNIFNYYIEKKYKGIIISGTGLGHVPDYILSKIKEMIDKGIFVGITTQTIYGTTSSKVYSGLRNLEKIGAIHLQDMTNETAYVKLAWVLGHKLDYNQTKIEMLKNYANEISNRRF